MYVVSVYANESVSVEELNVVVVVISVICMHVESLVRKKRLTCTV